MFRYALLLWPAAVLAAQPANSTPAANPVADRIDAAIAPYYRANAPGAVVIVTRDGQTVFRKAYGLANLATGEALRPEMVLRIASITKQFTAAAILLLEEDGKLSVADDIARYLPDFPTGGQHVTIEHLLTHTAGIPNFTAFPDHAAQRTHDRTVAQMIDRIRGKPLEFVPGTRYAYSNSGYVLLGAIVEKVSGMPYADFVARRIFEPLGMRDTAYEGRERGTAPHAAGHTRQEGGFVPAHPISMTQPFAAGGLVSTVDDLARWDAAIAAGRLLRPATWHRAFTPYTLADGTRSSYGYGWSIDTGREGLAIAHSGGIDGFATYAMTLPAQHVYAAVLQNSDSGLVSPDVPARKAAAIAIGQPYPEYTPVALSPLALRRFAGEYGSDGKTTHTVRLDGGTLLLQRDGPARELVPYAPTGFLVRETLVTVTFEVEGDGRATGLSIDDTRRRTRLVRTDAGAALTKPVH